jgi:uncharacterized protein
MISGVCNLMIVPGLLLQLSGPGVCHARERGPHWSGRYGAALSKYKWRVSLLSTAAMLGFLGMSTQLKSELNALRFFPDNAGIVKDYQFVAENFSGFSTIEMAIECPKEAFDDTLEALHRLETVLEDCPGVVRVDHLGTIRQFKQSLTDLGCHPSLAGRRVLSKLASRFARSEGQRRYLRVSTLVKVLGESRHACIIDCVKKAAKEVLPAGTRFHPTGITQLLTEAEQQIVCTQTKCFPLAAAIILVAIGLLYRSFRVLMVSIVPNLLPILSVLALMVVLDIPLDAATVMIATIAIGIAADDTIHFLSRYRLYKSQGLPSLDASALTLGEIGRAAFFTSVVAAAGFGTLALSPFPPMRYFGLLTALTMLTALLADVFILPAMCNLLRLWDKTNP